jgi:hypothetical protein
LLLSRSVDVVVGGVWVVVAFGLADAARGVLFIRPPLAKFGGSPDPTFPDPVISAFVVLSLFTIGVGDAFTTLLPPE